MKKILTDMLICPSCLPDERVMSVKVAEEQGADILEGSLTCGQCGKIYPIRNGIAFNTFN